MTSVKINIGCGPNGQLPGFDNLDNSPSALVAKVPYLKRLLRLMGVISEEQYTANWSNVIRCDASRRLPYANESVDKIYSSHFLEHIPEDRGRKVLRECYRVLRKGGVMRLVVPDLTWHARRYIEGTELILAKGDAADERSVHDKFLWTVYGAYLGQKRYGAEHCYMYDFPTLVSILKEVGFVAVHKYDYQVGKDQELADCDSRPEDSLHVEVRK